MSATGLWRLVGLNPPRPGASRELAAYTTSETVLVLVAAVTCVDGVVHVGAAVDHFAESPLYTVAFTVLAMVQLIWAAMLMRRPSRAVLLLGCLFTVGIIGLWGASRTVGIPVAPRAWVPELVGVADLLATAGELVTVIAIWSVLMSTRVAIAKAVAKRIAPLLVTVLLLTVLYGVGAHAG